MKKKYNLAIALCGAVLCAAAGYAFVCHFVLPTLEIRELVVTGEKDERAVNDVRQAVESELDGGFFSQDLDRIKASVERLTWVKSVTVTRLWPNSVDVTVTRLEPVARWEDGRLVSEQGVVYVPLVDEGDKTKNLPLIVADTTMFAPDAVKFLPKFETLASKFGAHVQTIAVTYRGSWSVTVKMPKSPTLRVELGRATESDVIFDRLDLVLKNYSRVCETMSACPAFVDARYENAFAVRLPEAKLR